MVDKQKPRRELLQNNQVQIDPQYILSMAYKAPLHYLVFTMISKCRNPQNFHQDSQREKHRNWNDTRHRQSGENILIKVPIQKIEKGSNNITASTSTPPRITYRLYQGVAQNKLSVRKIVQHLQLKNENLQVHNENPFENIIFLKRGKLREQVRTRMEQFQREKKNGLNKNKSIHQQQQTKMIYQQFRKEQYDFIAQKREWRLLNEKKELNGTL